MRPGLQISDPDLRRFAAVVLLPGVVAMRRPKETDGHVSDARAVGGVRSSHGGIERQHLLRTAIHGREEQILQAC